MPQLAMILPEVLEALRGATNRRCSAGSSSRTSRVETFASARRRLDQTVGAWRQGARVRARSASGSQYRQWSSRMPHSAAWRGQVRVGLAQHGLEALELGMAEIHRLRARLAGVAVRLAELLGLGPGSEVVFRAQLVCEE